MIADPVVRRRVWRRLGWNGLTALAAAALVFLLNLWPPFRTIEARAFDVFSTAAAPALADLADPHPVVIVAIDEPSLAEVGLQWPWPRSLHAELIAALRAAGARAVGLDLVFAEPSTPGEDAALARAMGPDVVLASDESVIDTPQARQILRAEPLPELVAAGAAPGLASVVLDRDGVLRRLPPWPDTFAATLRAVADPEAPASETPRIGYIQTLGPARTYPTVSYYQALDPEAFLPEGTFRDRIVLVGLSLQTAVRADESAADAFATSQTLRSGRLTPGVEMQATLLDNLRHDLFIRPAPPLAQAASILAAALLTAWLAWRPVDHRSYLAAAGLLLLLTGGSYLLLWQARWFLPPVAPALAVVLALAPIAARDQTRERRMRREITRAFSHYLAPEMVRRLARDPGGLKLGGERRTLTILFCDVRNFTPMAERMKGEPERLTHLVNRILTPLSTAVLDQGGTIDKYIGDCVMAFWNAPLDDPDHAPHAVLAGLAMLDAMARLNAEFAAEATATGAATEAPPRLAVGVGVNTGVCVVGNMGSDRRFDYSALGDAVNYASRLEGASKLCGVPLLLGAATAAEIRARLDAVLDPVLVDRVSVKGRSLPEPVYTVLPGPRLPAEVLARHDALMQDLMAGRRTAGDPEIAAFARLHPSLGQILEGFARRASVEDADRIGIADD